MTTIWRMRIAYWISKSANTHSHYAIFIAFPLQKKLHERALMLCYTHIACLVNVSLDKDPVFLLIKYFTASTC